MPTILIADDYPIIVTMLTALFELDDYTVRTATTGAELVQQAVGDPPDLILTDVEMPVCDGVTATRILRADPRTASVPIIVQSGNPGFQRAALNAGATRFFEKPVPLAELLATVKHLLTQEQEVSCTP